LIVVPPSLRYLERLWGTTETIKFIVFPLLASNVVALAFNWIEFFLTQNAELYLWVHVIITTLIHSSSLVSARYGMQYHGQMAIQTAVLVGFTQLIPEHQVQVMGVLKARVKVRTETIRPR
jgi:hypothetical protein